MVNNLLGMDAIVGNSTHLHHVVHAILYLDITELYESKVNERPHDTLYGANYT